MIPSFSKLCRRLSGVFWLVLAPSLMAADPAWWTSRHVIQTGPGIVVQDYAPAVQGQLKFMAASALAEMQASTSLDTTVIQAMVNAWADHSHASDFSPATIGQLKAVSKPFYDRLGLAYPWTTGTTADDQDSAMATLGQLKKVFSFDLSGFETPVDPNGDDDGDGVRNADENGGDSITGKKDNPLVKLSVSVILR